MIERTILFRAFDGYCRGARHQWDNHRSSLRKCALTMDVNRLNVRNPKLVMTRISCGRRRKIFFNKSTISSSKVAQIEDCWMCRNSLLDLMIFNLDVSLASLLDNDHGSPDVSRIYGNRRARYHLVPMRMIASDASSRRASRKSSWLRFSVSCPKSNRIWSTRVWSSWAPLTTSDFSDGQF